MNNIGHESRTHRWLRCTGTALFGVLVGASLTASALASDVVTLRVGDQKGGNRALLEIAGLAKDLPYKIEWSEFPAAAPILEALNAGALDFGYTGDLAFLTVYAAAHRSRRSAAPAPTRGPRPFWCARTRRSRPSPTSGASDWPGRAAAGASS